MGTGLPAADDLTETSSSQPQSDELVAWWIKLLALAVVVALCLAFAGLIWALAF